MKKITILFLFVLCLSGCAWIDSLVGIDDKGNKVDNNPPISYITELLKGLGPIGILGSALTGMAATAYAGHKRGKKPFVAIVEGIQKTKEEMSSKDRTALVTLLKDKIPDKYHNAIRKVKDTI